MTQAGREASPPPPAARGCWPVALILVGGLITLLSGLCVGGGMVGAVMDLMEGAAPLWNILEMVLMPLVAGGPFLAGGIALIVWGVRIQRRK